MKFFRRKPKTVDSITASLASMVEDLHLHANTNDTHAATTEALIYDLTAKRRGHEEEALRAREVAGRISALVA